MAKLTPQRIINACEALLSSPATTITFVALDAHVDASVEAEGDKHFDGTFRPRSAAICIDPSRVGYIPAALHEALHIVLRPLLRPLSDTVEEYIVRALEEKLWQKHFNKKRLTSWRRIIRERLKGTTYVLPSRPTRPANRTRRLRRGSLHRCSCSSATPRIRK